MYVFIMINEVKILFLCSFLKKKEDFLKIYVVGWKIFIYELIVKID